jgi:UDP-glucose 4-epimerase
MRLLITGSTGFLGGTVGRFAALAGHEVIGIARRSQADPSWPGRHVPADVASADLAEIIRHANPDAIFHGAGTASVGASFASPLDDLRAATMTFANLLDGVRRSGVRPLIIFPSSATVYGNSASLPIRETADTAPISPYGFHKLACELIAKEYSACFGLDTLIFRIFSVFGPAQRRLLVWEIYEQLRGREPVVRLQGSGQESRDYLHADDLASAIVAFAGNHRAGWSGECKTFNLAGGHETRVADLAMEMCRIAGSQKSVVYQGRQMSGHPVRWWADMSATRAAIAEWSPRSVSTALRQCIEQWQRGEAAQRK